MSTAKAAVEDPVIWNCWSNNMIPEDGGGGFIIHAFEERSPGDVPERALCGVRWAETGLLKLGEFEPGCIRCRRILRKRGLIQ